MSLPPVAAVPTTATASSMTLSGGPGDDSLRGGPDNDTLDGGAGNDTLNGDAGDDVLIGGLGNNRIVASSGADRIVFANYGNGDLSRFVNDTIIDFDQGFDRIDLSGLGVASFESILPLLEDGFDRTRLSLSVFDAQQTLDILGIRPNQFTAADFVFASDTTGRVITSRADRYDTLFGSRGNDTLIGGPSNDSIFGDAGNDRIVGGSGVNGIYTGSGSDTIVANMESSPVFGSTRYDSVQDFDPANDRLDLTVWGIASLNVVDLLLSDGFDRVSLSIASSLGASSFEQGGYGVVLLGVTRSQLSASNFILADDPAPRTFLAGDRSAVFFGGIGNDTITGGHGNDWLLGDAGDDRIAGGMGANWIETGLGADVVEVGRFPFPQFLGRSDTVADFDPMRDRLDLTAWGIAGFDSLATLLEETTEGTGFTLWTDGVSRFVSLPGVSPDRLGPQSFIFAATVTPRTVTVGGNGRDDVFGGLGDDTIAAGVDDDRLFGDSGNDLLQGEAGNDRLMGGPGNDTLDGGDGLDTAVFAGPQAAYRIDTAGGTTTVTAIAGAGGSGVGSDGTDTLRGVERVEFADRTVDLTGALLPTLRVVPVIAAVQESGPNNSQFAFQVILEGGGAVLPISVAWQVAGSGTNPADAADFRSGILPSGVVEFSPGRTQAEIVLFSNGDGEVEPDETFTVTLSQARGANIIQGQATGTFLNDDRPSVLRLTDSQTRLQEPGNGQRRDVGIQLLVDGPAPPGSSLRYSIFELDARQGRDFEAAQTGIVTFQPFSSVASFPITLLSDASSFADRRFTVLFTDPVGIVVPDGARMEFTILNFDQLPAPANLVGTDGPDRLVLPHYGTANGGGGDDTIIGARTADSLLGGSGNDVLLANGDFAFLVGGPGSDLMDGNSNPETGRPGSPVLLETAAVDGVTLTSVAPGLIQATYRDGQAPDLIARTQMILIDAPVTVNGVEFRYRSIPATDLPEGPLLVTDPNLLAHASSALGFRVGDSLVGTGHNDLFALNHPDQRYRILPGSDTVDGGAGTDVVVVDGSAADYTVTRDASGTRIQGKSLDVTARQVEALRFTDSVVLLVDQATVAFFDAGYYLERNGDVAAAVRAGLTTPEAHYREFGWREGRDPSPLLVTNAYLAANPDALTSGLDPVTHLLRSGGPVDGVLPVRTGALPQFDDLWYLLRNPDVADAVRAGLLLGSTHYAQFGWREGRDPAADFNSRLYVAKHPDVRDSGLDPLAFFNTVGIGLGHVADPSFIL